LADDPDAAALRELAAELLAEEGIVADLTAQPGDGAAAPAATGAVSAPSNSEATG
jgi:hypothetical protein